MPTAFKKIAPFALLSLVSFLCGAGLLLLMLGHAERLTALGLVGNFYYIILLPLGLSAAAFLFGVLRSYARYSGKPGGGTLELSGPIVGFALVVVGGFLLPQPAQKSFAITVLVHGENGPNDIVLRNTGAVWMTLGGDRRSERIGDKGQADFKNLPASFRGQEVPISLEADGFELVYPQAKYYLTNEAVYVMARRTVKRLSGRVQDAEGRPVTNAVVRVGEQRTPVDVDGHFNLLLPRGSLPGGLECEISAPGFEIRRQQFPPDGGDAAIMLRRTR